MKVSTVKKNPSRRSALRAEETRELIIQAAEREFAQKGFVPARLEDIAEAVGITRAAVIYHFNDKENLYNAVLESSFTALNHTINLALNTESLPLIERIELAVTNWIKHARQRPTLMRLFMREVADANAGEGLRPEVRKYSDPMFESLVKTVAEGQVTAGFGPIDPVEFWSILAGSTMFFIMEAPLLAHAENYDEAVRVDAYAEQLKRVVRCLLGVSK